MEMINYYYTKLMSKADPRVENLPLMQNPLPTMLICAFYVYFVKQLGPSLMANRKPIKARLPMIVYNFVMVIFSLGLVFKGARRYIRDTSLTCAPVDYSTSPEALEILYSSYAYFLSKFVEFMDTLFFVLRKKNQHISTLHVIHHGIMPFSVWWGAKFVPGGHAMFFGWANSIIHAIMYSYYGLAAIGPQMQKYLWWKKYLTMLQIIQFVAIGVHSFQLLFRECEFPKIFCYWIGFHGLLFLALFTDYYKKTYHQKGCKQATSQSSVNGDKVATNDNINCDQNTPAFMGCGPNVDDLHKYLSNNNNDCVKCD